MQYASIILLSLISSFFFIPIFRNLAVRFKLFDTPSTSIKIQERPIPYLGGIAILCGFILSMIYANYLFSFNGTYYWGLIFVAIIISMFGLIDDIFDIKQNTKFLTVLLIALGVALWGIRVEVFPPSYIAIPITVFYIVGACNALNNLDGLDGLAAGVSTISSAFFLLLFFESRDLFGISVSLSLIGACLAFLKFNFYPASIYMGDAGSTLLGFITAILMLRYSRIPYDAKSFLIPILISGVPIFDTAITIIRRIIHKKPIFPGDRGHFYDRLVQRGISMRRTVLLSYGVGLFFGLFALLMKAASDLMAMLIFISVLIIVSIVSIKLDLLEIGKKEFADGGLK